MPSSITFNHDCTILDACCIINLYATGRMGEILDAIPTTFAVADYVKDNEILKIYSGPALDVRSSTERITLQPLVDSGSIIVASINSEAESLSYINFAAILDDGEAITGALAVNHNWAIATDDKAAVKFFMKEAPQLQIISTLELIKSWMDMSNPSAERICPILKNIQMRANYAPGKSHPLYDWWRKNIDPE